jgi:hypothetical protein
MKRPFVTAALAAGLALAWSVGYVRAAEDEIDKDLLHRIKIGYAIGPVPLDLAGKNRLLVGLDAEGGNPFVGEPERVNQEAYLGGGVPFGPFVSRNLTPNRLGLPAGLTLEQFGETMRAGRDLKNRPPAVPSEALDLLQVMPWPVYAHMNDRDLKAVYEYLRAIPCVGSATRCTP